MGYASKMTRRNFLRTVGLGTLGVAAGAYLPKRLYADDLVENDKIQALFGKAGSLLMKAKGSSFDYKIDDLDVNGDGKPDKIRLQLRQGEFVTKPDNSGTIDGARLDMYFDLGDATGSERRIYGIVDRDGKVSICKSRNLGEKGKDVESLLDTLIKNLEK